MVENIRTPHSGTGAVFVTSTGMRNEVSTPWMTVAVENPPEKKSDFRAKNPT